MRLYSLQVSAYSSFRALAEGQHTIFKELIPQRGEIFLRDKNGVYPAAVNQDTKLAYAVPKEIEDPFAAAREAASILGFPEAELRGKLEKPDDAYELLKHKLNEEEISRINDLKIKGIRLADESYRYYPSGELAANILGFVGWKGEDFGGRYGVEAFFDRELKGEEGKIIQNRDASGRWITTGIRELTRAKDGNSLVLTIDHIIQYETEKLLKSAVEKTDADGGSVVVMEPETGKILAMANFPTFNPNEYSKVEDISVYKNPIVSDAYESGSVFKTFTIAAGIDSSKITPDSTYIDTGIVQEAGYSIRNSDLKAHGVQTMTQVLEESLNTGVIYVEKLLVNKNFSDYVSRFGFGEKTGIELPGEASGNIRNLKNIKSDIQFFTASFGQGITVTPIQLASAYSAIANGGMLMKPQIIDKIITGDGIEKEVSPQEKRRVISERAALFTSEILESVVLNGHGKRAGVPGYRVGGKTGTAQVASSEKKGYEEGKNIGSFAGFAPIDSPKFTIVVKMENPKAVEWAESSAAPLFGELMKFLLEYYNVEPTKDFTQKELDEFDRYHNLKSLYAKKLEEEKANKEKQDEENEKQQ